LSFTVALRSGGSATFAPAELRVADAPGGPATIYALSDLASASLVADTTIPVPPGAPPMPGVALRLNDGRHVAFTPVDPSDCWTLIEVIYKMRPELRAPLPPRPGAMPPPPGAGYAPPPPPPGAGYGYAPPPPGYASAYPPPPLPNSAQNNENVLAGIAHLSIFFGALIVPLVIWLTTTKSSPYASRQAKQAFLFHCAYAIVEIIVVMLSFVLFFVFFSASFTSTVSNPANPNPAPFVGGIFLFEFLIFGASSVIGIVAIVLGVYAAVQAFNGRPYHYPLLGRF
jgi:uncharacterized Tic20 family protein